MRRMLKLLIIIFIMYCGYQFLFYFFSKGHNINYVMIINDQKIEVNEILSKKNDITDGYYFNIKIDDNISIPFKILNVYSKQKNIIDNIDILTGSKYICANISLKNVTDATDIKCYNNGIIYFYSNIKGQDKQLDELVSQTNYNENIYINDDKIVYKDKIGYYPDNFIENDSLFLSHYKGIYVFGKDITSSSRFVQLYNSDQYNKKLEASYDKYYISPDYSQNHEFNRFILSNIANGNIEYVDLTQSISFNSFNQGFIDGKMYLIDIDNKRQYTIDLKKKTVEEVGNENRGAQIYTNGIWETKNINEIIDKSIVFYKETNEYNGSKYDRVVSIGSNIKINYIFQKNGNHYDVYAVYDEDVKGQKNYLFSCTDVSRLAFKKDRIYYINDSNIEAFDPTKGHRVILNCGELKYNVNLNYYVY